MSGGREIADVVSEEIKLKSGACNRIVLFSGEPEVSILSDEEMFPGQSGTEQECPPKENLPPGMYRFVRFIMGAPVYDGQDGLTKHLLYPLKRGQNFSDPDFRNIQRISTEQKAQLAHEEAKKRLEKLNVIYPLTEIVGSPTVGFEVHVSGAIPYSIDNLKKIVDVLNRIGVADTDFYARGR
jgi:hypothetical protein